jgi:hypothetical protein
VSFDTGAFPAVDVTFDNEQLLHTSLLPSGWPRKRWVQLRIGYGTYDSPGGLIIERDSHVDCRSFVIPDWAPQSGWRMALAAHTGLAVDRMALDNLTIATDALLERARVEVEVTLNGQQFTSDRVNVVYDAPITISHYSPTSGPISGDTRVVVHGFMFDHGLTYSCQFGETAVPAEHNATGGTIICPASPAITAAGAAAFSVSLDRGALYTPQTNWYGHRDWYRHRAPTPFTIYRALIVALHPTGGPIGGATIVRVHYEHNGTRTDSIFHCRFGESLSIGTAISSSEVDCPSPASVLAERVMVSISTNAQQFSNAMEFTYFDQPRVLLLSPSSGPAEGGTNVTLTGTQFMGFAPQICALQRELKRVACLSMCLCCSFARGRAQKLTKRVSSWQVRLAQRYAAIRPAAALHQLQPQ